MSYRYVYPNGAPAVSAAPPTNGYGVDPSMLNGYTTGIPTNMSYSPGSFSSDSESGDEYEYRGRMITRERRCPRDVVRAPTPPPIIKRVVERAPTPEAPVMERVIIRPQAQEIVERVIEQPRTPPPRIIQKEMQEEAPPPIVRTRVIKVDRPLRSGYSQPGSPFSNQCNGLPSFSNGVMASGNPYRNHSIAGSIGRPIAYHGNMDNDPSFSSGSSFEYAQPVPMGAPMPQTTMMMMPSSQQMQSMGVLQPQQMQAMGVMQQQPVQSMGMMQQQPVQSMGMMQQQPVQSMGMMQQQPVQSMGMMQQQPVQSMGMMQQQPVQSMGMMQQQPAQQQVMYRPVQMQSSMQQLTAPQSIPPLPTNYVPQTYMYPAHQGMSYGYRPMMQQGRMIPSGMPMVGSGNTLGTPTHSYPSQQPMFNPLAQQLMNLSLDNPTHIHYTRVNKNIYRDRYELYQLNILTKRNPEHQYKLLANFLRRSLFNKSNYEPYIPKCPIMYALTFIDHPENWRAMIFGTMKYPSPKLPYPYICFISVLPEDRQNRLASILLNQFINHVIKVSKSVTRYVQLHANYENCRAQKLYNRCGFLCNQFIPNGYPDPHEPQYKNGHMIRMELNLHNINNKSDVCFDTQAVEISQEEKANYTRFCHQNIPNGTQQPC
ncbi:hypothetical protein I4U23_029816 [Adineta vaga]|nr:hypothetical protein I4U23_029816 [Adineta vaga]